MSGEKTCQRLFLVLSLTLFLVLIFSFSTQAAELTNRKLVISDSRESVSNVRYTFYWTGSTTTLKCIKILFCDAWTGACNTPGGFNSTGAATGSFTGLTADNWALDKSTNGTLKLTNSAGEAPAENVSLEFLGITNPSNARTYYSRIGTFSNEDCSGSVDSGTVSFTITEPGISVTVTVPAAPTPPSPPPPSPPGGGGGVPPPTGTKVIIQGKAYPSAKITVLMDGKVATIISADSLANFKVEITNITSGIWTFGLWAEDKEGRRSITFSFTTAVTEGMTTTISGIFIPPTIELEKTNVPRGETLKIEGQTAPESEVSIHVESPQEIIKKTMAEKEGDWKHLFDTSPLGEGTHTTKAKAESPEGLKSSFSTVLAFYVGKYGVAEICPRADFNKDGKTNLVDFSILLYWWGKYNPCVDQNQDGIVNLPDFSILMYWWTG